MIDKRAGKSFSSAVKRLLLPISCIFLLSIHSLRGAVTIYISPPDIEKAEDSNLIPFPGATIATENFDGVDAGAFAAGTGYFSTSIGGNYTSASGSTIQNDNQYGGDGGNAEGRFLNIAGNSSLTLTLNNTTYLNGAQYFGFYFNAGDAFNKIELYNGNQLLLSFSTSSLLAIIPRNSSVTAINGSVYNTNNYYGKPATGQNGNEAYAYLHFVANGGDTFNKVVLSQGNTTAAFENDGHSILAIAPTLPGTLVIIPEPSLCLLGSFGLLTLLRRKRNG